MGKDIKNAVFFFFLSFAYSLFFDITTGEEEAKHKLCLYLSFILRWRERLRWLAGHHVGPPNVRPVREQLVSRRHVGVFDW